MRESTESDIEIDTEQALAYAQALDKGMGYVPTYGEEQLVDCLRKLYTNALDDPIRERMFVEGNYKGLIRSIQEEYENSTIS